MYAPVKNELLNALDLAVHQNQYADKVLQRVFKSNKKFGSRDRRELAESFYDIVRHYRLLVELSGSSLANMVDYYLENKQSILGARAAYKLSFPIQESIADDFYELLVSELGVERTQKEIIAMNEQAIVCLRTNTLLTNRQNLQDRLAIEDTETILADNDVGLFLKERKNIFGLKAFKDGLFEVQDFGSQKIAAFLDIQPGMRLIDACAGAGGKSLHAVALMKNKGKVICLDIHEWKLQELKLRARRAKASTIETRHIDTQKVIKRLHGTADRLLLDVPCTGTGVLKRNPDSKLKWSRDQFQNLLNTQLEILNSYSKMLRPDGKLVYATCSILPYENEGQIEKFLKQNGESWELEDSFHLFPSEGLHDGFYAARLKRRS